MISEQITPLVSESSFIQNIRELKHGGATLSQIADHIGTNFENIRKICHKEGIIKPRNIAKRLSSGKKISFRHKYLSGDYKNKEIAEMFDISVPSVKRLAKRMNLPNKYSSEHPKRKKLMEEVVRLYKKGLSTWKIRNKLGIHDETIRGYLIKLGIKRRGKNGLTKNKITRQNRIIKEMYLKGCKLKDIETAAKIGNHGIAKRLKSMGIERNRNPYNPIGNKYDDDIERLFLQGKNLKEIAKGLNITPCAISYRIRKHITKNYDFKILYYSKLFNKWRKSNKTYTTLREIEFGKRKIRKYISPDVQIKLKAVEPRVRPKPINFGDEFYQKVLVSIEG